MNIDLDFFKNIYFEIGRAKDAIDDYNYGFAQEILFELINEIDKNIVHFIENNLTT